MLTFWAVLALVAILIVVNIRQVLVFEHERGLRYQSGRFVGVVNPGSYWILHRFTRIIRLDIRPALITVPGQEVIAKDGVGLKVTVAAKYQVTDPVKAIHSIASYRDALYTLLQLAMREIVAGKAAEDILAARGELSATLHEHAAPKAAQFGLELMEAELKDVMFPGDLKKVFSQVVRARQEGLAALERARGETAALRNLANAASMIEQRPSLMQLRILQALSQNGGNTLVIGGGTQATIVPIPRERTGPGTEAPATDG